MRVLRRGVTILLLVLLVSPFRADSQPAQKTSTIGIFAMEAWPPIESLRQGFGTFEAGGLLAYTPNYPDLFLPRSLLLRADQLIE